ncbi:MAG: bifunctional hydroxymethylpyrimidine kinase/phosphomethylpyrimidine kinase [Halodesulfurarchaeum sp.]
MRSEAPTKRPVGLSIAGSDSGGGAGIQADLKTMEAHDTFGTSVVTSVTAQNTTGVQSTHVLPPDEVGAQIDAVLEDFDVGAAKTGMLATEPIIETVTERVGGLDAPLVVDPVMVAASGDRLLDEGAEAAYESLIARSTLVTPNTDETAVLTGIEPQTVEEARAAGADLLDMGADAALLKGGHMGGESVEDVLVLPDGDRRFEHPRIDTDATHGSGCTVSSAIVAHLASGHSLETAVEAAVSFMERAVRYHLDVGTGPGSVHHLVGIRERAARHATAESVESVVRAFREADVSALVPEVGTNVVGATPFAESVDEVAAVEGRITRTMAGVEPNRGVRFGASNHLARFLLGAREVDPSLRFATRLRFDGDIERALGSLDGPVASFDRTAAPDSVRETGAILEWGGTDALSGESETPVAVFDRGADGIEALLRLLGPDHRTVVESTMTLLQELEGNDETSGPTGDR